jgi:hypothetical protein
VLVVEFGNEDLDLLATNAVGVYERLRYGGHQPALGIDIAWRLLDGHDRHGALLSAGFRAPHATRGPVATEPRPQG